MKLKSTQFMFDAANAGRKSLDFLEESTKYDQPTVGADVFNESKLEDKLTNDGTFFASMSSVLEESEREKYFGHLETLLESTQDLLQD